MRNNHLRTTTLSVAFLAAALTPSVARANSCTVAPTISLMVGTRATTAMTPGFISDPLKFTATWQVGAMHDAECSNMTESGGVTLYFAAQPTESASVSLTDQQNQSDDAGTVTYTATGAHLVAQLAGSCACGILGGPSDTVTSNDIVVPVTVATGFTGWYLVADPSVSQSLDSPAAEMTVSSGAPIRVVGPTWNALLAQGESATEVVEYPDGTRSTNVVSYNPSDHRVTGAFAMDVNRNQVGDVKFYVEFLGTRSNVVTLHVTSGTGGDAGAGGDDAGTGGGGGSGGCSAAPGNAARAGGTSALAGMLAALALAVTRRRRRRAARAAG